MPPALSKHDCRTEGREALLRLALFLLADAHLEVLLLGFLERFVVVPGNSIGEVGVYAGALRQNGHQREAFIADRAEWPEPRDIRNCHTLLILA